ncbi:ribosome assembly RNA-binding protein YhbY [Candidatus Woesearchaeota archaeon]|nr:ribosome assembly RNA-binding protein YhbY [Candidatus Woesearchaeota archaeon]
MDTKQIKELRAKAKLLEPIVRIGKKGLTDETIKEIKRHLKKRKLVKVKILKSTEDRKKIAKELAKKTGAELIDAVGFVVVLFYRNIYKQN